MRIFSFFQATKILLLLFISCVSFALNGQFSIGVKAGLAKSWRANIIRDDKDEYIHKTGFQFSILAYGRLSNTLSLGIEPGYVPRITSVTFFQFEGPIISSSVHVNYMALPLYVSGRYPLWNERLKMNVKGGYGIAFVLNASRVFQPDQPFTEPLPVKHGMLNHMDNGFYSGIGIEYSMGKNRLRLDSDLYIGMRDVMPFEISKNRTLQIGLGYMLGL